MAEHDSKSGMKISKAQRRYKVGYLSVQHVKRATKMTTYYSRTPSLHLKGDWLTEAGFGTDTPVTVTVEQGQLVIRPVTE
ncbi:type I toxin-antitoxin system SymE family toxin [Enterobacteriaceae bacterium H20N1]|uniref:Type I toxin-antitoxin system SymE family toxin n=1 Tax=Dryocola boscaweniae TaxID=2925397 RepID=A0A9X2W3Q9_9ENTR|nr:SymE family type I addiction module toxin [Dryocola boscaweniae]MCT4700284.1 type I toxin-antitoxin system SymE family toxin [Dryocola boscaweniae]MCT4714505.1 type I toxin-antitoxin system SymE family toxin [Dryocola boscaweniae]MCT4717512.1 type I toxin-antitoxin system SymE family toxin [Dryocola boscaweniae]